MNKKDNFKMKSVSNDDVTKKISAVLIETVWLPNELEQQVADTIAKNSLAYVRAGSSLVGAVEQSFQKLNEEAEAGMVFTLLSDAEKNMFFEKHKQSIFSLLREHNCIWEVPDKSDLTLEFDENRSWAISRAYKAAVFNVYDEFSQRKQSKFLFSLNVIDISSIKKRDINKNVLRLKAGNRDNKINNER